MNTMTAPVAGALPIGVVSLPAGMLRYQFFRHGLLRGSGMDARLLTRSGADTRYRDCPDAPETAIRREHDQALDTALAAVREIVSITRVREAIGISNPGFHDVAFAPGHALTTTTPYGELNKRGRRQVRTAHRYVRRLLAKTESNSYFGPTLAVTWDPALSVAVGVGAPVRENCVCDLSYWTAAELAGRFRRSVPANQRGWRRDSLWRRDGQRLSSVLTGRQIELTAEAAQVWEALATPATPADLVGMTALPSGSVAAGLTVVRPALRPWPDLPATEVGTLDWLGGQYPAEPLVTHIRQLCQAASTGTNPLGARAKIRAAIAAEGLATSRSSGAHYADRDVITEDRSSPWSDQVRLGAPAIESAYRALARVLPLLFLGAMLRQADARESVLLRSGGRELSLVELASRDLPPVSWRAAELTARLEALVPDDGPRTEIRLDPAALDAAIRPLWRHVSPRPDDVFACLPGFDLMCAGGEPGRGRWVLGECHDDSSSALGGITSRVQPRGRFAEFTGELGRWLDVSRMATVVGRRRSRHITPELPGLRIELSGTASGPRDRVAAAADVRVSADASRVVYQDRRYQLYPGDVPGQLFAALTLPCVTPVRLAPGRPVTPRIVIGDMVLQRRSWRLPLPALGRGFGAWRAAGAWQRAWDMPDQVFLRHPGEPKPLLIDFRDALAVDDLSRLSPAVVSCAEVLPELRDTWWELPTPQPAELRIPVLLRWEPTAEADQ